MRTRNVPKRKAPACTHVSMERIPVNVSRGFSCPSCGNYRSLGFLYVCRQERDIAYFETHVANPPDADHSKKSVLRREMEDIGLSESVIVAAEQGLYTDHQLDKLKAKKTELNGVIAGSLQAAQMRDAIVHVSANSTREAFETIPSCQIVACHACRPYFRDRISMSFDAVFKDEVLPLQPAEADFLPVKSAQIIRNISCRPIPAPLRITIEENTQSTLLLSSGYLDDSPSTPSQSSTYTYKTTQSEIDTLNTTRRHRRRFYKMGHRSSGELSRDLTRQMPLFFRQGLKEAFKGIFRATARDSSSSGSNITLPMPHTAAARDTADVAAMGEFDMGALRRVKRQKDRFDRRQDHGDSACASEHDNANWVLERRFASRTDDESGSSGSILSVHSFVSEGSEVEVEGGVALTEEAVETHTPNIISDPESIMTQV
ncbi:hypothetical protein P171DRAFT_447727 [Karstenula rhodostoma CBS 690.94]|uniref:Uncharacterized protein n=1 Tax=Karstenula rhodostoma CBS 690.94 TaxID=1392251 RepID=A0A9P4P9D1_9PLEO|nr:hypothetical protein P171DRAFT_447727 [Karstenula rhodostoma CBS 690.94]